MGLVQISKPEYKWVCDICGQEITNICDMVTVKISEYYYYRDKTTYAHRECLSGKSICEFIPPEKRKEVV